MTQRWMGYVTSQCRDLQGRRASLLQLCICSTENADGVNGILGLRIMGCAAVLAVCMSNSCSQVSEANIFQQRNSFPAMNVKGIGWEGCLVWLSGDSLCQSWRWDILLACSIQH